MIELTTTEWQRVIDTNLTSAFVIGREAAKRMIARGRGKIINIGSLTSELARATVAPYTVAKGGIKMLTRAMAAEWAELGIQANAIGPGYMLTDMNQALIDNPAFDAWVKGRTPSRRWGTPHELVGAAVFLASRRPTTSTARSSTSTAACRRCSDASVSRLQCGQLPGEHRGAAGRPARHRRSLRRHSDRPGERGQFESAEVIVGVKLGAAEPRAREASGSFTRRRRGLDAIDPIAAACRVRRCATASAMRRRSPST